MSLTLSDGQQERILRAIRDIVYNVLPGRQDDDIRVTLEVGTELALQIYTYRSDSSKLRSVLILDHDLRNSQQTLEEGGSGGEKLESFMTHGESSMTHPPDDVHQVWAHWLAGWKQHIGRGRPPNHKVWLPKIKTRLKSYSVEDLKAACDAQWADPWLMGSNPDGKKWCGPEQVFDSDMRVEKRLNSSRGRRVQTEALPPPRHAFKLEDEDGDF